MTEAAVGLVDRLNRIDDRLGISSAASVERRLDDWPGARERWDALAESERDSAVHAVLRGRQPQDSDDVPLWFAALDAGEASSVWFIMAASVVIIVTVFAAVLGLEAWTAALVIGVSAGTSLGQAFQLRRFRDHRRDLVLTMLPARDLNRDRRA